MTEGVIHELEADGTNSGRMRCSHSFMLDISAGYPIR